LKTILYIFFLNFWLFCLQAQTPYSLRLNQSNGLPSNAVYDVMQDSKGFIWLATDLGLIRYDGEEYKTYYSKLQTSLSGSSIREDKKGRIWYENFDGYLYFVEKDSLYPLRQNKPLAYMPVCITEKYLFVVQSEGIDIYDIETLKVIKSITNLSFITFEHCTSSHKDFFFVADDMLYRINEKLELSKNDYFQKEKERLKQIIYHQDKIYVMGRYNLQKKLWVFDINLQLKNVFAVPEITASLNSLNLIEKELWLHTPKGTYNYAIKPDFKFQKIYFEDRSISAVIKDRQDNYWFSTTNQGVLLVANLKHLFFSFDKYLPYRIAKVEEDYLIATKKGELILYDKNFRDKKVMKERTDNNEIYFLHYDSTKKSIFYSSKGFTHLPKQDYSQRQFYEVAIKDIVSIEEEGYYAFASSAFCGLIRFDKASDRIFGHLPQNISASNILEIISKVRGKAVVYHSSKKQIYFATNLGLFRVSLNPYKIDELTFNNSSFYASRLFLSGDAFFALSTKGNFYWIEKDKQIHQINHLFGAGESEVYLCKQFGRKILLLCSKGLFHFDMFSKKVQSTEIHINPTEINDFTIDDNFIFLLSNEGATRISISDTQQEPIQPKLQIKSFKVANTLKDFNKNIVLNYYENDINISFSVLDFSSSRLHRVYYRLNKASWKELNTHQLRFEALQTGTYFLEFKINEQINPKSIKFIILSPFWKTTWFWLLCFALFFLLGFAYYRWQIKKLREQNKLLQEKIILEQQFNKSVLTSIKSQMNPHFFYNALNTIQAYIFTNDKIKANSYLAKFSKLTRLILEHSEKENISLAEEIEALTLYLELEKMRFKEDFSYEIHTEKVFHRDSIELPPMIIQPYVENAIKHGLLHKENDKKLDLIFEEREKELLVIIEDNGIGRKRSTELNQIKRGKHISFATQANEKRLEILNKASNKKVGVSIVDKYDKDLPTGTKVILNIPLNDKN